MKFRKGVLLVVFKKENNKTFYLLLKRKLHWKGWEFPKGGIEKNESLLKAIKRELKEETGLQGKITDMKISGKFNYPHLLKDRPGIKGQIWRLFAVQVNSKKIRLDKFEHSGYKWLEYKEAYRLLTWQNRKKCLKLVNDRFNK